MKKDTITMRHFILLVIGLLLAVVSPALATPSGLNNIPTADVAPTGVLVLQAFSLFGDTRQPGWYAGAKYGPATNWEIGLDDLFAGPDSSTGPVAQAKYRFTANEKTALAAGVANISSDTNRNGELFPYLVASTSLGRVRGHLGYSAQQDNAAWFVGADGAAGPVTLRTDWMQTNDGDESVWSLGFIAPVAKDLLVESWASFPSASGIENDYIVKLDYVIALAK